MIKDLQAKLCIATAIVFAVAPMSPSQFQSADEYDYHFDQTV
jgi:hypothetical protein